MLARKRDRLPRRGDRVCYPGIQGQSFQASLGSLGPVGVSDRQSTATLLVILGV